MVFEISGTNMHGMTKTKRAVPDEQKLREGEMLFKAFELRQKAEPDLTQESLIHEMGLRSQSQFVQWCKGTTPIPDKRVLWLADRLGFSASEMRPTLSSDYAAISRAEIRPPVVNSGTRIKQRESVKKLLEELPLPVKRKALADLVGTLPVEDAAWLSALLADRVKQLLAKGDT